MIKIGDTVKWENGKKPLGKVIERFRHNEQDYAVVKKLNGCFQVVRIYEKLQTVEGL